jgi:tetratricopeptide (TPR) repeat protein
MNKLVKYLFLLIVIASAAKQSHAQQSRTIDSLQTILKTAKEDTNKVNTLNLLGIELKFSGNNEKALNYYNQEKQLSEKLVYKKGIADSYINIGIVYSHQGNYTLALKNYFASLKIVEEIKDKKGISTSYNNIANIYYNQGNYPEALKNHFSSLKIAEEIKDKEGIANSYNNIASIYYNQGNYPEALKNFFTSLKIREEIKNKKGVANSYNNIGNIYADQGNYSEALKNYFTSLKIKEEIRDKNGIAGSYNNIGLIYEKQGNYPEALKNYFASLKIREKIKDKKGIAYSYNCIGVAFEAQGNYPEALKNYFASLKIAEDIKDKLVITDNYINLGVINIELRKLSEAKKQLNNGLSLSKEMGNKELIKNSYNSLAKLDSIEGNWKQAYEHCKLFSIYKDSLNNEENTKKIVQTQMQYEFEKKEGVTKAEQDKKDVLAKQETQKQKIILLLVSCFLLLVAVLAVFIFRGYQQKQKANHLLANKNKIIEEKSKEITDSINYAKRIQHAMLPPLGDILSAVPNSFVLFKPKDIVSGDFYFFHKNENSIFMAAADCTGHGVPGAFMSLIGTEKLKDAVSQSSDTSEILNLLNRGIKTSLRQSESHDSTRDGMDIALCSIDLENNTVSYAGANRPLWIIRKMENGKLTIDNETSQQQTINNKQLIEIKATKKAIGGFTEDNQHFDTHEINVSKGDTLYIFTDGYADQFGGEGRKKFMTKRFKDTLLEIQDKTMQEQEQHLDNVIENWKAGIEQIDDILVIGIRL